MDMVDDLREAAVEIAEKIIRKNACTADEINSIKKEICQKHHIKRYLTNIELLSLIPEDKRELLRDVLMKKPIRTLSGVSVVSIMTKPAPCPHGRCSYCPGGPNSFFGDVPQSYTGREPAAMRAINCNFDPYLQVMNRLEQYCAAGHSPEKIELIIMGGTFPALAEEYQQDFVTYAFKAMNDFSKNFYEGKEFSSTKFNSFFEMPSQIKDKDRTARVQKRLLDLKGSSSLEVEQDYNEHFSRIKCVAMCIETRPDYCREKQINEMLRLGTTRVELGVESIYEDVLKRIKRGHSVSDVIAATKLMKDAFLKVGYHIMPGLPGSSKESDIVMFREIFENPDFRPDNLKIYPCMVLRGTELYDEWKAGIFTPLNADAAAEIIAEGKRFVPEWCRIMRVQRDIPTKFTEAGVEMTNLRQLVALKLKEKRFSCKCIRCREARAVSSEGFIVKVLEYEASGGTEVFIQAEDKSNSALLGFARLRIPGTAWRSEILPESAGIRELHVYGRSLPLGKRREGAVQHLGIGKALMAEAEHIAKNKFGIKHIYVISGIGVREYYRKLGYLRAGAYMKKDL
ncbi:MAG: tRNA uridine(34) 5-carboxymethylaminomethyl modification radical SAM/GNAT enzyme Elp3 [Candidatus Woesearchaeota archaeon]